jgi:hypothetical protein
MGSINSGRLFRTLPTSRLTGHAFISSAGYGLSKSTRWPHSEIMPGMDARKGKLVVIGNLLHMDALLSRLRAPGTGFKSLEFPLIDKDGNCTWPAMCPTDQSLKDKERDMGPISWQREMLLKIVAEDEAVIRPEDIHYYDARPNGVAAMKGHGIDLAISQKEGADYTAIVSGEVLYVEDTPKIFIRPSPYNEHVTFHDRLKRVRAIPGEMGGANLFFVEDVAYQKGCDPRGGTRDAAGRADEAAGR